MTDEIKDTVSREAHDRITKERDEARAKLTEATAALTDMLVRDKTRTALKGKVADPDGVADFFLPHLRGVEVSQIDETLGTERFTQMMSLMSGAPAVPVEGEPAGEASDAPISPGPQTSFAGPNPGATGGPAPEAKKVRPSETVHMTKEQRDDLESKNLIGWSSEDPAAPISIMGRR